MKIDLNWLTSKPNYLTNITWGIPWKKGELDRRSDVSLWNAENQSIPVQTWPLAYWPDGSVKWTAHSANLCEEQDLFISNDEQDLSENQGKLVIEERKDKIKINNETIECTIQKHGENIFNFKKENQIYDATLETIMEERVEINDKRVFTQIAATGKVENAVIESKGDIRAVVRLEGAHYNQDGQRFLPFILRIYFYDQISDVKIVHTMINDTPPDQYFIKGMGLKLKTSYRGEAWNRHVQIAGDKGVYSEPGQLILTRRYRNADGLYNDQIENKNINLDDMPEFKKQVQGNATWNDFKIIQDSADHYKVVKRRGRNNAWIEVLHGKRANGLLYAGGADGGVAIGQKKFWQKFPSSLEVEGLNEESSSLTVWLWSPDCEAMDLRHYSDDTHVPSAYEGFEEMRATPVGIGNTNELFLSFYQSAPTADDLFKKAEDWQNTNLLICNPAYYHSTRAAGMWSLPDRSNKLTSFLEDQLGKALQFYQMEIDQRSWYGFWNYGDVMHTYDPVRHQWRYDMGGFAWQNTELVPNIWFWYAFLRSGNSKVFEMAEAMTRHTSEVDCYHEGEYKGLGSRHNVSHWGCGCKEVRISMANLYKIYYYLTADERTGEILSNFKDADQSTVNLDPMREFYPKDEYPTHTRVGPDWAAFSSNWLCNWERTENSQYLEKILTGVNDLKKMPYRLLSGPTYGYDPQTSHLYHMGDGNSGGYHMIIAFGAPQVWMELAELINDKEWEEMIAEFGEFYTLSDQEKRRRTNGKLNDRMFNWPMFSAGMVAYAAMKKNDQELAEKAWNLLLDPTFSYTPLPIEEQTVTSWKVLNEIPWITTNTISQWSLNVIVCLELLKDLPAGQVLQKSISKIIK
ncbi:hypothetical protein SAMN04487944_10487 [Gracilibacillus ureilyticus]|uniref:Tat pathway signal sequence domain protein n=1 Tax=Gracilibacillus ureilyticus TaxID=531814 RepID=A0A1H9P5I3_9BACI|nr:hypothetical protein [Gracilibacillus ureilyticus]SER42823.1 hypothetical protein SAMN04487944_10487 [Gracilibacillus ureilyticus]